MFPMVTKGRAGADVLLRRFDILRQSFLLDGIGRSIIVLSIKTFGFWMYKFPQIAPNETPNAEISDILNYRFKK